MFLQIHSHILIQIQSGISDLQKWANSWQVDFNISKSEFLKIITSSFLHISYHYANNELINGVKHFKYLGIAI